VRFRSTPDKLDRAVSAVVTHDREHRRAAHRVRIYRTGILTLGVVLLPVEIVERVEDVSGRHHFVEKTLE
jgi:hypothetical protein